MLDCLSNTVLKSQTRNIQKKKNSSVQLNFTLNVWQTMAHHNKYSDLTNMIGCHLGRLWLEKSWVWSNVHFKMLWSWKHCLSGFFWLCNRALGGCCLIHFLVALTTCRMWRSQQHSWALVASEEGWHSSDQRKETLGLTKLVEGATYCNFGHVLGHKTQSSIQLLE